MVLRGRSEFAKEYNTIKSHAGPGICTVLIMVAPDCDALCACRILSQMFKQDDIIYVLKPVAGYEDMKAINDSCIDNNEELRSIILLNCGSGVDLSLYLSPLDATVYVLDCHRPVDHHNLKGNTQVVVFVQDPGDETKIPDVGDSDLGSDSDTDSDLDSSDSEVSLSGDSDSDRSLSPGRARAAPRDRKNQRRSSAVRGGGGGGSGSSGSSDDESPFGADQDDEADKADRMESKEDDLSGAESGIDTPQRRKRKRAQGRVRKRARRDAEAADRKMRIARFSDYYIGESIGTPSSLLALEFALVLGKEHNHLLWLAIVGVTDLYLRDLLEIDVYNGHVFKLRQHVLELNTDLSRDEDGFAPKLVTPAGTEGHISFSDEMRLMLHRHWTLWDSMKMSPYLATRLGTWRGPSHEDKLRTILAHVAIPRDAYEKSFVHMSTEHRELLRSRIKRVVEREEFSLKDFFYSSFHRKIDYRATVAASDYVYAVNALLECAHNTEDARAAYMSSDDAGSIQSFTWHKNFLTAFDALGTGEKAQSLLRDGIAQAMKVQRSITRLAHSIWANKRIVAAGFFRYVRLDEMAEEERRLFTQPRALARLGAYLTSMHQITLKRWLGAKAKPLILCSLKPVAQRYVVVGIPVAPEHGEVITQQFYRTFKLAADDLGAQGDLLDGFDYNVMHIDAKDHQRFIKALNDRGAQAIGEDPYM